MINGFLQYGRSLVSAPPSIGFIGGADGPRVMLVSGVGDIIIAGILAVLVIVLIVLFIVRGRRKKRYRRIRKTHGDESQKNENDDTRGGGNPSES